MSYYDYSWDCYRETIFEKEIDKIISNHKQKGGPCGDINDHIVIEYLEERLKEIKTKYKE